MPLAEPLRSFWRAYVSPPFVPVSNPRPWGVATADPRFPQVWDANQAMVFDQPTGLTLRQIQDDLSAVLSPARVSYEHVEFWALDARRPPVTEARSLGFRLERDAVMVFEADPSGLDRHLAGVTVREITDPGEAEWAWYRRSRSGFGDPLPSPVLDQLVRRDRMVFQPNGLRLFFGYLDDRPVGSANLLSLEGAGYVDNVVTIPQYRRRGVATATVVAAIRASLDDGDRVVHLLAEAGGRPLRLYERLGFRTHATVDSYTRTPPAEGVPARS